MKTALDMQAVGLPENYASNNGANIDYINNTTFEITLSVSKEEVRTKDAGKYVVDFQTATYNTKSDLEKLETIFQTRVYSTNIWASGCMNDAYAGMTGITLDFDHDFTIEEAKETFADYNYILHTSSSHRVIKDGVASDRFRVILPFTPGDLHFTSDQDAPKVYRKVLDQYPQADKSCKNPGRKFFPGTSEKGAVFYWDVHVTGKYFSIDISDVPGDEAVSTAKPYKWDGKLRPKAGLLKVIAHCPFVKWMSEHIDDPTIHIREPLKYALITNLARFEGGRDAIHDILKRDWRQRKYDEGMVDRKIENALRNGGPQKYVTIRDLGWTGVSPEWPASPAGWSNYVDMDGILARLKSLKGKDRIEALRSHLADDLIVLSYARQVEWLTRLAQELQLGKETLERLACDAICRADLDGRELKDVLTGASGLGASPEDRGLIIYRWFTSNGGLVYRDREHRGYWIWEGTVYELGNNQPFYTFIWRIAGLTHEGIDSRKIWAALKAETDTQGTYLKSFTWLRTDGSKNTIYLHLNLEDERILRIDPTGATLVDNGSNQDAVLLAPASKMVPVSLEHLDDTRYRSALGEYDSLVLRNLATTRNNQLLFGCWAMTYPLMDYVKTLPHLRCDGVSSSGKTRGMELISQFIYGDNHLKKATEAANYTDGARNPLVLLDNVEVANFNQGLGDFVLTAATGITKEKRVLGTDRDTVLEKVHCLVATNGIENLGKTKHINRTIAVKFNRWKYPGPEWSERVFTRIAAARSRLLSAHMLLVSRVLAKIAGGRLEWWQDYLERKHPGHAKDRSNSFIGLMAIILEELLPVIDPNLQVESVVSDWIKIQNQQGKQTAVESNTIVGYLEAILEDASISALIVDESFRQWGYEVKVVGRKITGTASQLHHTFAAVARRKGLKYEYKDARQLSMRIADTAKTLAVEDGKDDLVVTKKFLMTTEKDRTKTTIYTFDFDGGKPDDENDAGS